MTRDRLEQMHKLALELRVLPMQIDMIKGLAYGVTAKITGMPHGSGVSDKVGNAAVKFTHLENILKVQREKYEHEMMVLTDFLEEVEDAEVRAIIRSRCACGKMWKEVAEDLGLGSEETVRSIYRRFCERLPDMHGESVVV